MSFKPQALAALQVIGVRYAGTRFVGDDQQALNTYLASGVFELRRMPSSATLWAQPAT